jgi:hypothetical protein
LGKGRKKGRDGRENVKGKKKNGEGGREGGGEREDKHVQGEKKDARHTHTHRGIRERGRARDWE